MEKRCKYSKIVINFREAKKLGKISRELKVHNFRKAFLFRQIRANFQSEIFWFVETFNFRYREIFTDIIGEEQIYDELNHSIEARGRRGGEVDGSRGTINYDRANSLVLNSGSIVWNVERRRTIGTKLLRLVKRPISMGR